MPTDKLRIVHVFRAPLGGLFRHVLDLASEQAARGHEVGMFFDRGGMCARVEDAVGRIPGGLALGVGVTAIARMPGPSDIGAFMEFSRWLRGARPDVVHGHGSKGGILARMSVWSGAPGDPIRAYTPHGGSFNYRPGSLAARVFMTVERFMAGRTDLFLFESENVRRCFDSRVGVSAGIQRVVVNGLRDAEFEPVAPDADAADLLYVGELRAAKGIDTMLAAMALVARSGGEPPSAEFFGSGPERDALIQRARSLGLGERVSFPGPAPIRQAFKRGKIVVAPSRAESMPYVVLEAAAAQMPLISTRVGGIPEIFGPFADRLGPCDDADDLARRIVAMLETPAAARAARAAELARHVRANFSLEPMIDEIIGLYREALKAREPARVAAVGGGSASPLSFHPRR